MMVWQSRSRSKDKNGARRFGEKRIWYRINLGEFSVTESHRWKKFRNVEINDDPVCYQTVSRVGEVDDAG